MQVIDSINSTHISTVVVPCSARKREPCHANLRARELSIGSMEEVGNNWLERVRASASATRYPAADLYCGRGFRRAHLSVLQTSASLFVVSAGMGLVGEDTQIPPYDITLHSGSESSVPSLINAEFDPSAWWRVVQGGPFASDMHRLAAGQGRIVIALSRPYALLVGASLSELPVAVRQRLRILGRGIKPGLPAALHPQLVNYDERLDVVIRGTKLDAWSRDLSHFVGLLSEAPMASVREDQKAVNDSLEHVETPASIQRSRVSDDVLISHIKTMLEEGFTATSALKQLRRVKSVACEERRFRRLFEEQAA